MMAELVLPVTSHFSANEPSSYIDQRMRPGCIAPIIYLVESGGEAGPWVQDGAGTAMKYYAVLCIFISSFAVGICIVWDTQGYVMYCPCMGRFGNQAEQFLGSLGFAKQINRTLILPPWRSYALGFQLVEFLCTKLLKRRFAIPEEVLHLPYLQNCNFICNILLKESSVFVVNNEPFDSLFEIDPIKKYHRVILAEDFMKNLAPVHWPIGKRVGWCFHHRYTGSEKPVCEMKKGNPMGPFWDHLKIDFDSYEIYGLSYASSSSEWISTYPADKYPVMAFKGAPSSFPVSEKYVGLQKYLEWSVEIKKAADNYINENYSGKKFVGIHLRNGIDWKNACERVNNYDTFMSSYQCYGFNNKKKIDYNVCFPSEQTILRQVRDTVVNIKAEVVYISTDKKSMLNEIKQHLQDLQVEVFHHKSSFPQLNIVILGRSNHFIGSCISSFSAFVSRDRKKHNLPSSYWGYTQSHHIHSEL